MLKSSNNILSRANGCFLVRSILLLMMCVVQMWLGGSINAQQQQAVAARNGATTPHLRRITPIIPDANRFDPGKVFLENADILVADEKRSTEYRVLRGNVKFRRGDMTLTCDSAYFYEASSSLDAFGHVVMNQADTMTVYCDVMHYFGNVEVAKLRRHVRVVNRSMTVTTDSLDYDMFNNVARYFGGGTVVDRSGTRITSRVARYEHDTKKVQFTSKVYMKNDKMELFTDILDYDMSTHIATIEDETKIVSLADGHTIYTSSGWYNLSSEDGTLYNRSTIQAKDGQTIVGDIVYYDRKNDKGQAQGNVVLTDEKTQRVLTGDVVDYDRKNGEGKARGNVVITDMKNKVILEGEVGYHNEKTKESYVTENALAREFSQKDTIYIHADTLRSITVDNDVRILIANKYVRFFRKDLQGVCDSAAVSEQDSILNLYRHAVIWSEGRQISGEEINVHVKDSVVDWATLPQTGLLVEHLGEVYYNQLSGRSMKAYFENQELRQLDVSGDVEALFYPMENDSTYNKLVNANSAYLTINMKPKQEVEKIKMWPDVTGKVIPLFLAKRSDLRLEKFRWYDSIRPKQPLDVMDVSDEMKQIFGEAVTTRRTIINRY
ncbi:MAG: hypothetical protein IKT03_00625 [Muribaculaceae bacterium]|nr:hypothetical protein [Muribaculaceae bacterium]MBR6489021.1 hypothetical protein [Muribaculaceae bacterium]